VFMKTVEEKQMIHMRFDAPLLKRMDDFRFKNRFESRSDAARWLLKFALDQKPVPKEGGKR
jgi:metal-responsive CopG/Arc/MetJ family transcriptional regulator